MDPFDYGLMAGAGVTAFLGLLIGARGSAEAVAGFIAAATWLAGAVLAAGWWKLLAVCLPFYAWYLVVERAMVLTGFIQGGA